MSGNSIKYLIMGGILVIAVFAMWFLNRKPTLNTEFYPSANLAYTEEEAQNFYSKKIIKYMDIFKNNFFLKYEVENTDKTGKVTKYNEEYSVDSGIISIYNVEKMERIVIKESTLYYVNIPKKTVSETNINMQLSDLVANDISKILFTSLATINNSFSTIGYEDVKGTRYYYEEYNITNSTMQKARYYFDNEDTLKHIKVFYENGVVSLITFERIDDRAYDFSFTIPEDYRFIT